MGNIQRWSCLLLPWLVLSCGETSAHRIAVALRTDFGPVSEFEGVTVHIAGEEAFDHLVRPDRDYVEGVRVGEADVAPGEVTVVVSLFHHGRLVIEREVSVRVEAPLTIVTVVITRDCRGVVCPGEGNPLFESCHGGQCVDPRCTVETPEFCPAPSCDAPSCTSEVACVVPTCRDGLCFQVADDGLCGASEVCAASTGCVMQSLDGGVGPVANCMDGIANGDESDVDCGGACTPCQDGAMCSAPTDCESGVCNATCAAPSCTDGIQNGAETEVDCGGECMCSAVCEDQTEIPLSECRALEALYISTGGPQWINNLDWFSNESPCSWLGVVCGGGNVRQLVLHDGALEGSLPAALGNLTELSGLSIGPRSCCPMTVLSGPIPTQIANITGLRSLHLTSQRLDGPIPTELANLTALETLNLSGNLLTGTIPPGLGDSGTLQILNLAANRLTGVVPPELANLAALEELHLGRNQLTGGIPAELGSLASLRVMSLDDNPLGGSIPASLSNLGRLEEIYLDDAELTGPIPPELGNLSVLRVMSFDVNLLAGEIPPELANLPSLTTLDLSDNRLSGAIPPELGGLETLTSLELHRNFLTGSIPPELGNLSRLISLSVHTNSLVGPLPPELGDLGRVQSLIFSVNLIDGPVPGELGNLTMLRELHLHQNRLSGEVPDALMGMTALDWIFLCPNSNLSASPAMQTWLSAVADNDWVDGC